MKSQLKRRLLLGMWCVCLLAAGWNLSDESPPSLQGAFIIIFFWMLMPSLYLRMASRSVYPFTRRWAAVLLALHACIFMGYAANGSSWERQRETGGAQHMHIFMVPLMDIVAGGLTLYLVWFIERAFRRPRAAPSA